MSSSAPNVNSIVLVGHLTADPVLRALANGQSVCDLRLAVNDQPDKPVFVDVATFGPGAEACAQYLTKGRPVAVTGRLTFREWETKDGNKRSKHQVVGHVAFGGKPKPDQADPGENEDGDD